MRDLDFDIRARDKTAAAFDSARRNARDFNGDLDRTGRAFGIMASAAKGFVAGFSITALAGVGDAIRNIVSEAADLVDLSDKVGINTDDIQTLAFGLQQAGVEASSVDAILTQWTKRIGEAHTQGGRLADIFRMNGVSLTDANGKLRSSIELMKDYADLVRDAGSEAERQVLMAEAFGRAASDAANGFKDGRQFFDDAAAAIRDAGGLLDSEILRRSAVIDDEFAAMWRTFEINAKSAILNSVGFLGDLRQRMAEWDRLRNAGEAGTLAGSFADPRNWPKPEVRTTPKGDRPGGIDEFEFDRRFRGRRKTELGEDDDSNSRRSSTSAARDQADAYQRVVERLREEQQMLGLNETAQRILSEQRRAGVEATSAEGRAIAEKITAIEAEREAMERLADQQEAMNEAADYLSKSGFEAMWGIATGAESAEDAVRRLGLELLKAAAYAAFFNEGPLSGIVGEIAALRFGGAAQLH